MSTITLEAQIQTYAKEAAEKLIQIEERRKEIILEFADKVAALPGIAKEKVARIVIRCLRQLNCKISSTYVYETLKERQYVSKTQSDASTKSSKERMEDGYDPATKKFVTLSNYSLEHLVDYSKSTLVRLVGGLHEKVVALTNENENLKKEIEGLKL